MNSAQQLTEKQTALAAALTARNTITKWWFGATETRLYVHRRNDSVYLTFDDAAECFGAKVHQTDAARTALIIDRIAFYEALRIGNPESLPAYLAEVAAFNEANIDNDDVEFMYDGQPQ